MRVAIIHENWGAGAARCAQDLCRELGGRHEIRYFPRSDAETADSIMEELLQFGPDFVNCHSFYGNLPYEFLVGVSKLYPTCFTVHDIRPIGTFKRECYACEENATCRRCPLVAPGWRRFLQNRYYRERKVKRDVHGRCAADMQIVTPSRWMVRRLGEQELNRFELHHIPNGIDLDHFKSIPDARANFSLPADRPV